MAYERRGWRSTGRPDGARWALKRSGARGERTVLGRVAALSLLLLAVCAPGVRAAEPRVPVAVGARIDRTDGTTRLTFDLSAGIAAHAYVVESPDRVIVDLPQVDFQLDPAVGRPKRDVGSIKSFRFGLLAPGRSRIVIDLSAPATLVRVDTTSIAGGDPSRLVIELGKPDRAAFHGAALAAPVPTATASAASRVPELSGPNTRPVVVIDPGHGGIDPGASGNGVVEKAVVFDFASDLAAKLTATGRYAVVMTRHDDSFVSLGDRVRVARDSGAALFISIHADSLGANSGVTGSTVYIASNKASDAEAARVADSENQADAAAGVEAAPDAAGVDDILFDLTRRETRTYAHVFQRTLVGYWEKVAHLNKNPERAAGFKVLQAPDVPSALLELGYLSSDRDVKTLTSPEWRDRATTSIVTAVDAFFAPRRSADPVAAATDRTADAPQSVGPFGSLARANTN